MKATLDVSGEQVRVHVAGRTILEALDALEERLRRNLERVEERRRARRHRGGASESGEWRHGDLPGRQPEYFERPAEERQVVRRKTYALALQTPEEAVLEMQSLDHDFYLFTDADTGEESVVYRTRPGGVGLLCIDPPAKPPAPAALPADPAPAPVLLLEDAVQRLNASGERFVFFVDAQTRRGNVLYRRYDGHYGLIEPAQEGREP